MPLLRQVNCRSWHPWHHFSVLSTSHCEITPDWRDQYQKRPKSATQKNLLVVKVAVIPWWYAPAFEEWIGQSSNPDEINGRWNGFGQILLPCLGKRVWHDIVPHIGSHRTGTIVKRMPTWENKVSIAITRVGWIEAATDDDAWTTWQRKYDLTSWFGALSIIRNQTLHCRVCSLVLNMQITIRQNHNYWDCWAVMVCLKESK